eukprot:1187978-Prorocentrum_minimum.AAC.3
MLLGLEAEQLDSILDALLHQRLALRVEGREALQSLAHGEDGDQVVLLLDVLLPPPTAAAKKRVSRGVNHPITSTPRIIAKPIKHPPPRVHLGVSSAPVVQLRGAVAIDITFDITVDITRFRHPRYV